MTERSYRLTFTEAHRLELDRTLGELLENAQKVLHTQGRLRSLLRASQSVTEQLDLPTVLKRILEAATDLVEARHGALGVFAPNGHRGYVLSLGASGDPARLPGDLPLGRGPGFIGVPLLVRGDVFATLSLFEAASGEFSQEDEQFLSALAATAGSAIDNARLFDETQRRQRWSSALAEITGALLSGPGGDPIELVIEGALTLAEAELACLVREVTAESMMVEVVRGTLAPEVAGLVFDSAGTLTAKALHGGQPVIVGSSVGAPEQPLLLGPTMVVPMTAAGAPRGALIVSRGTGHPEFTAQDVEVVGEFAAQASIALALVSAREDQQRLVVLEDRSRIASDLHDHVIQRLFAAGLSLDAASIHVADEALRTRISDQVQSLDEAILAIRTAIFALTAEHDNGSPLRQRIIDVVTGMKDLFEGSPRLAFTGPVDFGVPDALADDLLAAVREGLTNVARHASATEVRVFLDVGTAEATLRISDDGVGITEPRRRSGIANLERRAKRWDGGITFEQPVEGGTTMIWRVRLDPTRPERAHDPRLPRR